MGVLLSGCGVAWRGSGAARMFRDLWIRSCESGRINACEFESPSPTRRTKPHDFDSPAATIRTLPPSSSSAGGSSTTVSSADSPDSRSEEHTSELQSLMRISYAVFCLKKKTHTKPTYQS